MFVYFSRGEVGVRPMAVKPHIHFVCYCFLKNSHIINTTRLLVGIFKVSISRFLSNCTPQRKFLTDVMKVFVLEREELSQKTASLQCLFLSTLCFSECYEPNDSIISVLYE